MRKFLCLLPTLLGVGLLHAQAPSKPIGQWRSFYPYKSASSVATDGKTLYVASEIGFFSYDAATRELVTHSKADGMADAGTDRIGYDTATKTVIITYTNGNIDLYRTGSFYNIPDLRVKSLSGSKQVADVYAAGGRAYLSTSFGVLVLNLSRDEVAESYEFTLAGQSLAAAAVRPFNTYLYAATPRGLYRAPAASKTLQAFSTWQRVAPDSLNSLAVSGGQLWAGGPAGVLRLNAGGTGLDTVYRARSVRHVDAAPVGIFVSEYYTGGTAFFGRVKPLGPDGRFTADSFRAGQPNTVVALVDSTVWCADGFEGLTQLAAATGSTVIRPSGPNDATSFDLLLENQRVTTAHGAYGSTFVAQGYTSGFSVLPPNSGWTAISNPAIADVVALLREADGTLLFGSLNSGLGTLRLDGGMDVLKDGVRIERSFDDPSGQTFSVISLARDLDGNLIVGQFKALSHEVAVRTPTGIWVHYTANGASSSRGLARSAAGLLVDDYNQKWWFQPQGGGVFVYDDAHTPEDLSDDRDAHFTTGAGAGGLPSAGVLSLVKDRDGAIWVGTDNGIGIFNCAGSILTTPCDADWPVRQFDAFPGRLFENERVNTIAVDGANRKWVGTNNGVWLLSPNADKIIERFTAANSPMPSNIIQKIAVDGTTGDVYIGTDKGLMSYRGTATTGAETAGDLKTFPNPVPSGYSGTIAIHGFTTDADVRITDISGQLVCRTTALGGQAVWNGLDYTGKRPQSGVYLILATNKDGSQTAQGKLVFLE